jgi:hypothetical protein
MIGELLILAALIRTISAKIGYSVGLEVVGIAILGHHGLSTLLQ